MATTTNVSDQKLIYQHVVEWRFRAERGNACLQLAERDRAVVVGIELLHGCLDASLNNILVMAY